MNPVFTCPNQTCGKPLRVPEEFLGRKLKCPHCAETFVVPRPDGAAQTWVATAQAEAKGVADSKRAYRRRLAPYGHAETIAEGGMGVILRCEDEGISREVAVKVMKHAKEVSQEQRVRFIEEAQISGQLEHPNIVPVHEQGFDEDGNPYFTMKLVRGRSLGQILKEMDEGEPGPRLSELLQVFLKVCDAIAFAHSRGVIHRDLKPDNIMVGDFGEVLVMDWGLAKVVGLEKGGRTGRVQSETGRVESPVAGASKDSKTEESTGPGRSAVVQTMRADYDGLGTLEGAISGTPAYMSPEQAQGKVHSLDARSDVYSLGAVLYQILTLEPPVTGQTLNEVLKKASEGEILLPEKLARDRTIPRELSAIAMKAMSKQPENRYPSAGDLSKDIRLFLEGRSVSAKEDTLAEAVLKLAKRNKAATSALSIAFFILVLMASWFVWDSSERREVAQSALEEARGAQKKQLEARRLASDELAQQAIRSAEEQRWDEARFLADTAAQVAPWGLWGAYARGILEREMGDLAAAEKWLRQAVAAGPSHQPSVAALAQVLSTKHETKEAASLLETLGQVEDWRSLLATGDCFFELGRYRSAESAYQTALEQMNQEKYVPPRHFNEGREKLNQVFPWSKCEGFYDSIRHRDPGEQVRLIQTLLHELHGQAIPVAFKSFGGALSEVDISLTRAKYLQPFQGLSLRTFQCNWTPVTDLRPLRGMPLENLSLAQCGGIRDLTPLLGMPLKTLNCYGASSLSNLTPLQGLPISRLYLSLTAVTDLTPLKGMPLEFLLVNSTPVTDLSPLRGMRITELDVSHCHVTDLTPIQSLPLQKLQCNFSTLSDLSALKGLPLTYFTCGNSQVHDLTPLAGMPLKVLRCDWSKVKDLRPLRGMPLEELDLTGNPVSDLSPLREMPLQSLICSNCPVSDLDPLWGMPLKNLVCENTAVKDLHPLRHTSLSSLSIAGTAVTDLSPLRDLPLRQLVCANTPLRDLSPLQGSAVDGLDISGCPVSDLGGLKGLNLVGLNCSRTQVTDLNPLRGMPLQSLYLSKTRIVDLTPLAEMQIQELRPPEKRFLTAASMKLLDRFYKQGCNIVWE